MSHVPTPLHSALVGIVVLGLAGGAVGLVLGLRAHPPTAWFAVIEVGLPAAIVGALVGAAAGLILGRSN